MGFHPEITAMVEGVYPLLSGHGLTNITIDFTRNLNMVTLFGIGQMKIL